MALVDYGNSDDEDTTTVEQPYNANDAFGLQTLSKASSAPVASSSRSSAPSNAAPDVLARDIMSSRSTALIPHNATEIMVNLSAEQMALPVQGPINPFSERRLDRMNTVNGFVEDHSMSAKDFEDQQRSFDYNGYAYNPSMVGGVDPETGAPLQQFVGDQAAAYANGGALIQRASRQQTKAMKRKRKHKGTVGVVEFDQDEEEGEEAADPDREREYIGPWAKYEEEKVTNLVEIPDEYEEIQKKSFKRPHLDKGKEEIPFGSETSIFHGKEMRDYQGRTYMSIPRDVDVDLEPEMPGQQECFAPKKCIHTWTGHTKGVNVLRLFPGSGHLMLTGAMDNNVKLWDIYHEGKCLRTFKGHVRAIRDLCFTNDGRHFLTASFDGAIKRWDTETGACLSAFQRDDKTFNCVKFHPEKQNIFLAGTSDRKIMQYDLNTGEITQEYNEHLGGVNTITFCDENRRFVTTADDKTVRVWDFDIPVVVKYIADPSMHSMPAATAHPDGKWIGLQSLDNQVALFSCETFRLNRKKAFRGYSTSGYACQPNFSPDGKIVSVGDSGGRLHFWDWKTSRKHMNATIQAHSRVLINHSWLPHETSKIITASWDGQIKLWD